MEIEVVADEEFTDKEVLEKGLELDLNWGRLRPTDLVNVPRWTSSPRRCRRRPSDWTPSDPPGLNII